MKKNEIQDLRSRDGKDLKKMVFETRRELAKAKLEQRLGKHTNNHVALRLRKKLAVLQTLIKEAELRELIPEVKSVYS